MRVAEQFVLRDIAGDYVIVPIGEMALSFDGIITVNETGAFIWKALQEEVTADDLVAKVLDEYEVDKETARKDVEEFLTCLRNAKILQE